MWFSSASPVFVDPRVCVHLQAFEEDPAEWALSMVLEPAVKQQDFIMADLVLLAAGLDNTKRLLMKPFFLQPQTSSRFNSEMSNHR